MELGILLIKDLFFNGSEADFQKTSLTDEDWNVMKRERQNLFWHSNDQKSSAEFVLTTDGTPNGYILYRRANFWGNIHDCTWTLDNQAVQKSDKFEIGKINLLDFKLNFAIIK